MEEEGVDNKFVSPGVKFLNTALTVSEKCIEVFIKHIFIFYRVLASLSFSFADNAIVVLNIKNSC